jgi:hypothetical protein
MIPETPRVDGDGGTCLDPGKSHRTDCYTPVASLAPEAIQPRMGFGS